MAAPEEWEDITAFLREAAAGMAAGRMIHGDTFSLRESMSAVELMDPKMDTSMHAELQLSLEETLQAGRLPRDLSAPQMVALMDELLACEQSWQQGRQLAYSIFLCWYCHRPSELLSSPVLRAYIRAVLRSISVVRDVIINADVYEEEDFASREVNSLRVGEETTDAEVDAELAVAIRAVEARLEGKEEEAAAVGPLDADPERAKQLGEALLARLKYRQSILIAHRELSKPEMQGLDASLPHLRRAAEALGKVEASAHLASPGPGADGQSAADRVSVLLSTPGFDKYIARQLLPGLPPREPQVMARKEAFTAAGQLVKHLSALGRLSLKPEPDSEGKATVINGYDQLLEFCKALSMQAPCPSIVVRSHLLWLMHSEPNFLGRGPLVDRIRESMAAFCVNTADFAWLAEAQTTIARASQPVAMIFRLFCENRARQRRKIPKLLEDWGILQNEAYMLDTNIGAVLAKMGFQSLPDCPNTPHRHMFLGWMIEQSFMLLTHYFLLGLELELFQPKELNMVYWHLDLMQSRRLLNRDQAYRLPLRLSQDALKTAITGPLLRRPPKGMPRPPVPQRGTAPPRDGPFLLAEAHMFLARGLCFALNALEAEGVAVESWPPGYKVDRIPLKLVASPLPDIKLSPEAAAVERNREIWYAQRFLAASRTLLEPRPLPLREFDRGVAAGQADPTLLLGRANDAFQAAKAAATRLLQQLQQQYPRQRADMELPYVRSLAKAAVANAVCLLGLRKAQQQHSALRLVLAFENPHFPVITLAPVAPKKADADAKQ